MSVINPSRRQFIGTAASVTGAIAATALSGGVMATRTPPDGASAFGLPPATEAVTPFVAHIPQGAIDDLRRRLRATRFPDKEPVSGWSQGVPLARARSLVNHWAGTYDWRQCEARLNSHPQYRTRIDGLGVHFIHARSPHPGALPILLTHGWPGSVIEFLDVIDRLLDPPRFGGAAGDAFDVVVPSLPGYGFSDRPTEPGWELERTARAWGTLMQRLGYTHWVAQGGDWGSAVTHTLARQRPPGLVAAHVNLPLVVPEVMPANPGSDEQRAMDGLSRFGNDGIGYFKIQATRPQTLGYGLADSPVAQAMWILEKFQQWSDNDGDVEHALSVDRMLDDISLYWFTNTGTSSARFYWEIAHGKAPAGFSAGRIELPMAATVFPKEIYRAPRAWAEKSWPNLFYWNEVDRGGHFAAFEQPALFASEIQKAFRTMGRQA